MNIADFIGEQPPFGEDELLNIVRVGIEGEAFFNSPVGEYVVTRASNELNDVREALETAAVHDIPALQQRAAVARNVITWIQEMIRDGKEAELHLRQNEDLDNA